MTARPWRIEPDGLRLAVRLTPRSRKAGVVGIVRDPDGRTALAVKVAAPPVEGAANEALIAFLSKVLKLPASAISFRSGETARLKMLHLAGDGAALAEKVDALTA